MLRMTVIWCTRLTWMSLSTSIYCPVATDFIGSRHASRTSGRKKQRKNILGGGGWGASFDSLSLHAVENFQKAPPFGKLSKQAKSAKVKSQREEMTNGIKGNTGTRQISTATTTTTTTNVPEKASHVFSGRTQDKPELPTTNFTRSETITQKGTMSSRHVT